MVDSSIRRDYSHCDKNVQIVQKVFSKAGNFNFIRIILSGSCCYVLFVLGCRVPGPLVPPNPLFHSVKPHEKNSLLLSQTTMVAVLRGESLLAVYNFDLLPDCRAAGSFVSVCYSSVVK